MKIGSRDVEFSSLSRHRWNVLDLITIIAKPTRPAFMFCDLDVKAADRLREELDARGIRVTITAILLKAISIAQLSHPTSRSFKLADGRYVTIEEPIAGFTVEREVEGTPVVFFANIPEAHKKPLAEIAKELEACGKGEIEDVPQLAKEQALTKIPWLLRQIGIVIGLRIASLRMAVNSASFGLTSLGKFGIESVLAPNVSTCIFGVGSAEERPVARRGRVVKRKMMTLTLAADINVMELETAAHLLRDVKRLVETGLKGHLHTSEIADEPSREEHSPPQTTSFKKSA